MASGFDFDLFVIGGGSGGVRAARVTAGELGLRVGLAEGDRLGGTCVIRGCVPKKLMFYASGFAEMGAFARGYGWNYGKARFDWSDFQSRLAAEITRLEGVYRTLLVDAGVRVLAEFARVTGPHEVTLSSGKKITAKHILIATGGQPSRPEFSGSQLAITSEAVFDLPELPHRLLVVGGGYIACEFACIFKGIGCEVTQFYRGDEILRGFDNDARQLLHAAMTDQGIDLHTRTHISDIVQVNDDTTLRVRATSADGDSSEAAVDQVLLATGRIPNIGPIDRTLLEGMGVEFNDRGAIVVDAYSQTAVPSVFAIGDVTDRLNLTPVAIHDAMAFVNTVFRGQPTAVDHELVATAIFTRPEYGAIGLDEASATAREEIEVYSTVFTPMQEHFAGMNAKSLIKIIVSRETQRVLGCHIVAPGAGELIQLIAIAIKMGATKADIDRTMAVHPTFAEELVTMRTARQAHAVNP